MTAEPRFSPAPAGERYHVVAASLHWLIAALIIFQVAYAWWVLGAAADHSPAQARALGVHMSLGLTVLVLSLIRLAVRLTSPPPPLPVGLPPWERTAAQASHFLFYVLIIGLPLTGWIMASLRPRPIVYWGWFVWPHLPGLAGAKSLIGRPLQGVHTLILLWSLVGLLVLHIAGAIKNQAAATPVLWRMLPMRRPALAPVSQPT